jgi:hypothetical protein
LHGGGTLLVEDKFLSLRIVREALERKFKIVVIEETSKYIKCKIVRFARLYGFPVPFPNPTLEVTFRNENSGSSIKYLFTFYDYYLLALLPLPVALLQIAWPRQAFLDDFTNVVLFLLISIIFFGFLMFLDTKYFVSRIRRALLNV